LRFGKEETSTEDKKPCLQGFVPSWSFLTRLRRPYLFSRKRKDRGETQKDLADFLGIRQNQIGEMENGRKASTFAKLALLCEHYNISADYLLGLTDEPRPLRQDDGAGR